MPYGLPWSEAFVGQFSDKEFRDGFVADQIRTRIAMLIRALREQPDRDWSQMQLGREMGKPQSVVSRLEDPDYGKVSLQTLLDVVSAFGLPLWVDIPEWADWFEKIRAVPQTGFRRTSFDDLMAQNSCLKPLPQIFVEILNAGGHSNIGAKPNDSSQPSTNKSVPTAKDFDPISSDLPAQTLTE